MNRIALATMVLAMIAAAQLIAADDVPELGKLTEKIKALEAEVAALKKKVAALEQRPPLSPTVPRERAVPGEPLPKGWQPREYNGQRYFAIPLGRQ
ncbi:MAG: hypothetical protein M3463_07925 [Verrucomicrobiota bacterium]|nr:hypothetical protein [Verrucomicrobiota bacterium]